MVMRQTCDVEETPVSALADARWRFRRRVVKFAAVGFSGVLINLGLLYLLAELCRLPEVAASALAIELSILWNFALNNAVTFRDRNPSAQAPFASRLLRYNLVGLVGLGIQLWTFVLANKLIARSLHLSQPGIWKYASQMIGIACAMAFSFSSNFFWTWGQKSGDFLASPHQTGAHRG
jgi:putative flippase GtrA